MTKKTYQHVLSDGKIIVSYEEKEISSEDKFNQEENIFIDKILKKLQRQNELKMEMNSCVTAKNFNSFKENLETYLNEVTGKDNNEKEKNRKMTCLHLFLEVLQDRKKDNINNWIKYVEKTTLINNKNIVLSLYITGYVKEAKSHLKKHHDVEVSTEYYDNFLSVFEKYARIPDSIYSSKEKKDYLNKEKDIFFNQIMKLMLVKKLENNLPDNNKTSARKKI